MSEFQLRFLFAKDPKIMGAVLRVVNRAISTYLLKKAGFTKKFGSKTGSVTFIQRFGGSLNLNIHFHMMYLDGVYTFDEGKSKFHFITPPLWGRGTICNFTPDSFSGSYYYLAVGG